MIQLPWTSKTSPHFVLEVNRQCNISCRGCYKAQGEGTRSLDDLAKEIDVALTHAKIHTVTLAGGEPTLHPKLCEIVRLLHDRRLKTAISTNGVALSTELLGDLSDAGLDVVMLHLDEGQTRPDLSTEPSVEEIHALRRRLAERIASFGIDVGLSVTIYPEYSDRVKEFVEFVLRTKHVNLLYATHHLERDGPDTSVAFRFQTDNDRRTTNAQIAQTLRESLGLEPFAFLPRQGEDSYDCRSLSYLSYYVPVVQETNRFQVLRMKSSWMDSLLIRLVGLLSGRFPFYVQPRTGMIRTHVLLNGLGSRRLATALRFLTATVRRGATVGAKRLVFDNGPVRTADGRVICTEPCPNRTLADGKLVPVCMSDMENRV
ncbi:MAG: radical SAM protein [Candidatus Nealsonbacteria bacterium]|nr:radical SAM protein [Candidatus Nealsonbacteria bacterium]